MRVRTILWFSLLLLFCGIGICCRCAECITRDQVLSNLNQYLTLGYFVEEQNVYSPSHNPCSCYNSSCTNILGVGWWMGEAYSYGNWKTTGQFVDDLWNGEGAGSHDCCAATGCVTGIDCSGLISRGWQLSTKHNTETLAGPQVTTVILSSNLLLGDILNKLPVRDSYGKIITPGHVVCFYQWVGYGATFSLIESSGSYGRVRWRTDANLQQEFLSQGYVARKYNNITTTGICITDASATGGVQRDTVRWTGCEEAQSYNIYRSDDCWGPYVLFDWVAVGDTLYTGDRIHFVYIDSTVTYSRPYFYKIEAGSEEAIAFGTPLNLPQPTLPATPTGFVASNVPADCGNSVSLSWQTSAGADSYYVFRSSYENLTDCTVMHDFVGRTAGTSYEDNNALQDVSYSYGVTARNECGSSEASGPDTAIAVREVEGLSLSLSQVSVGNDSIMVCPGGDGDSLAITVRLLNACGEPIVGEPPSSICAVLDSIDGNVTLCFGDTLRPSSATDQGGYTHIVAHHIGGCGKDTVRVCARGQALAQQPLVAFRSPDLNADGVVYWAVNVGFVCPQIAGLRSPFFAAFRFSHGAMRAAQRYVQEGRRWVVCTECLVGLMPPQILGLPI